MQVAVFLLAGRGSRLGNHCDEIPKCLIEVNGNPILHQMLDKLNDRGIKKSIFVVGYLWEEIQKRIGERWKGMDIEYVVNEEWESTNNIVSFYMAKDRIDTDFFLIEGDIIVGNGALDQFSGGGNQMAVSPFQPFMDGTVITKDNDDVKRIYLKSDPDRPADTNLLFKTVNIYTLTFEDFRSKIVSELERIIESGETNVYYEQAFANLVNNGSIQFKVVDFADVKWAEVDNFEDLRMAEKLFNSTS
jgi:choline kinase